jgi:hypothetical protein
MMALGGRLKDKEAPSYGEGGTMKYRNGGMIYGEQSASVTLPDESAKKEKRFVKSNYGSGEDRITETDIRANPWRDPYTKIHSSGYGRVPKEMDTPGYFLMEGYTDEQQARNVERGRPDARQTYVLEVNPDGSKRVVPFGQLRDEFTSGAEGETATDILEAMDIPFTKTDNGFMLPSKEQQIRRLMDMRENYGLGDITFKDLQNEMGLNIPEMQEGEYREALEQAMGRRAAGQVTQARASRQR